MRSTNPSSLYVHNLSSAIHLLLLVLLRCKVFVQLYCRRPSLSCAHSCRFCQQPLRRRISNMFDHANAQSVIHKRRFRRERTGRDQGPVRQGASAWDEMPQHAQITLLHHSCNLLDIAVRELFTAVCSVFVFKYLIVYIYINASVNIKLL